MPNRAVLDAILRRYPNAVPVSAATGMGLDRLAIAVSDALSMTFRDVDVETDVSNGKLMAYLAAKGEVMSRRYEGERVIMHCRIPQKYLGRINDDSVVITPHSNGAPNEAEPLILENLHTEITVDQSKPVDDVA